MSKYRRSLIGAHCIQGSGLKKDRGQNISYGSKYLKSNFLPIDVMSMQMCFLDYYNIKM